MTNRQNTLYDANVSNEEPTPDQPEPETEEPTTPTGPAHSEGTGEVVNPEDKEQ